MFFLIFTVCASAAMDDCRVERLAKQFTTKGQCEQAASIYRAALGPADNYRIECKPEEA